MKKEKEEPTLTTLLLALMALELLATASIAQDAGPRTRQVEGSLMSRLVVSPAPLAASGERHLLLDTSMFAIAPPEVREFQMHDLVQIIVRESSEASSSQELETEKDYFLDARVSAFPDLSLTDILNFQVYGGRTTDLPVARVGATKDFEGEGEYSRRDDLTARLSAEIIEILPNGNLILEANTRIQTDKEISAIRVTGICRPDDISGANTIISNQLHDLRIEKMNEGELRESSKKGIISQILDTIFAF